MRSFAILFAAGALLASQPAWAQCGMHQPGQADSRLPRETGQGAFAAIQEIVAMLNADPNTDWSRVNIDALREHLIDMDNVALRARIAYEPVPGGERIHVSGDGPVRESIERMLTMHVAMAGETDDWRLAIVKTSSGADVTVMAKTPLSAQKIKALGLIGILSEGIHHQRHHMMMARGATHR